MTAKVPQECDTLLMQAINDGDLDGAVRLYEPNATLITDPSGSTITGRDAIREFFAATLAAKMRMSRETLSWQNDGGDLALTGGRWKMVGCDADGNLIELSGHSREVVRRQPDGSWLFSIDHPWGAGLQ